MFNGKRIDIIDDEIEGITHNMTELHTMILKNENEIKKLREECERLHFQIEEANK